MGSFTRNVFVPTVEANGSIEEGKVRLDYHSQFKKYILLRIQSGITAPQPQRDGLESSHYLSGGPLPCVDDTVVRFEVVIRCLIL